MTRVVVDETLKSRLHNLVLPLELCDASGRVLAKVVPYLDPSEYNLEPQISAEEIRNRQQFPGKTYTTAEVLKYLESL